jgi:hypothetical protein
MNKSNDSDIYYYDSLIDWINFNNFNTRNVRIIIPILNCISFLFNSICFLTFLKIVSAKRRVNEPLQSNIMYKCLFSKSICDMIPSIINALMPLYIINNYNMISKTLVMAIWRNYFNLYLSNLMYLASGLFEVAASFNCAISIENKLKWFQTKLSFYLTVTAIFGFCFLFHSYQLFGHTITNTNTTNNEYKLKQTDFAFSISFRNLKLSSTVLRDFVVLIFLIILNVYILYKMIQIRERRTRLQNTTSTCQQNQSNATQAEQRKAKMIILLFLIYAFGHLPYIIYYLPIRIYFYLYLSYITSCSEIFLSISYITPLFIYFWFDKKFNRVIKSIFQLQQQNRVSSIT